MAGEMKPGGVPLADTGPILLTGASGYVGGRLLSALERDGYRVRCLARRPEVLRTRANAATGTSATRLWADRNPAGTVAGSTSVT